MSYQDINAATIDRWIKEEDWEWGRAISHEEYIKALNGDWDVKLTPVKFVPHEWFGDFKGKKLLGLASGGGQQIPIFTALGADCTVLDYSDEQLASEKMVAEREKYKVNIVKADMTKTLPFEDESFDIIFHPVSNCYIESVEPVFKECHRILKKGGILLCGLDTIINYILDENFEKVVFSMPFNPLKNEEHKEFLKKMDCGYQFSHGLSEQLGGQLKAGFILTNIEDDTDGEGRLHEMNIPTFIMTRAVKL